MITIDESIRAVYYIAGRNQDWMAAVTATPELVRLVYRFRYYDPKDPDNEAFSNQDKKRWQEFSGSPEKISEESVFAAVNQIYDKLLESGYSSGGPACKFIRGSMTLEQFAEEFTRLPFVHTKVVKP